MRRFIVALLVLFSAAGRSFSAEKESAQWIVVVPPAFRAAVEPLIEHRRHEGLQARAILFDSSRKTDGSVANSGELRTKLESLKNEAKGPVYVLIVGVVASRDAQSDTTVPAGVGTIGRMKNESSDHDYGLPDKNLMPTIAVGRLPARTANEAAAMIAKTLEFERRPAGDWQNRLAVLEGHPGGDSELERRSAEAVVPSQILNRFMKLRPDWTARFVVHVPNSPYYAADDELREASLDLLRNGDFWTFYLGHSSAAGLWSGGVRYLDRRDWAEAGSPHAEGLLFTCGCFACQTAGFGGEGYGLAAIRNSGGPAAVVGAHGESYAAAGLLALDGLLALLNAEHPSERLADYWMAVQNGLLHGEIDLLTFWALDNADGSHGKVPLAEQRREHAQMWTLLGDPALRMPAPAPRIDMKVSGRMAPGQSLKITGHLPQGGSPAKVRLAVERPLGSAPANDGKQTAKGAKLKAANDYELASETVDSANGQFEARLLLPAALPWPKVVIRATAAIDGRQAQGALSLPVAK